MNPDATDRRTTRQVVYSQTSPDGATVIHYVLRALDPRRQFRASSAQLTAIGAALRAGKEPELPDGTMLERSETLDGEGN